MIKLIDLLSENLFQTSLKMKPYEKLIVGAQTGLLGDITLNDNSLKKGKKWK